MSHRPQPEPRPTLLVFTLGAEAESRRRRLLPERWSGAEVGLRRACLESVLAAGREAGCRLVVSCPEPLELAPDVHRTDQEGGSFGERLERSLEACLERFGGPVVLVGTDIPGLEGRHVRRALAMLGDERDRVALGPSPDGGFYLLATHRPIADLSSAVSWCCGTTRRTLEAALERAGRPVEHLDPLADLDGPSDLERWLATACKGGRPLPCIWHLALLPVLILLARRRRPLWRPPSLPRRPFAASQPPPRGPPRPTFG